VLNTCNPPFRAHLSLPRPQTWYVDISRGLVWARGLVELKRK